MSLPILGLSGPILDLVARDTACMSTLKTKNGMISWNLEEYFIRVIDDLLLRLYVDEPCPLPGAIDAAATLHERGQAVTP